MTGWRIFRGHSYQPIHCKVLKCWSIADVSLGNGGVCGSKTVQLFIIDKYGALPLTWGPQYTNYLQKCDKLNFETFFILIAYFLTNVSILRVLRHYFFFLNNWIRHHFLRFFFLFLKGLHAVSTTASFAT